MHKAVGERKRAQFYRVNCQGRSGFMAAAVVSDVSDSRLEKATRVSVKSFSSAVHCPVHNHTVEGREISALPCSLGDMVYIPTSDQQQ